MSHPLSDVGAQLLSRATAWVTRWHREPVIHRSESLAEHHSITGRIAYEVGQLLVEDGWDVRPELLCVVANYHDEAETITGDFPAGLKRGEMFPVDQKFFDDLEVQATALLWQNYPTFLTDRLRCHATRSELTDVERQVLKYADSLSALGFILDEAAFGNARMRQKAEVQWTNVGNLDWPWLDAMRGKWGLP
jgi:5'-deoxynucleotidase YfbR-like HD superfamily hydrolase